MFAAAFPFFVAVTRCWKGSGVAQGSSSNWMGHTILHCSTYLWTIIVLRSCTKLKCTHACWEVGPHSKIQQTESCHLCLLLTQSQQDSAQHDRQVPKVRVRYAPTSKDGSPPQTAWGTTHTGKGVLQPGVGVAQVHVSNARLTVAEFVHSKLTLL